MPEQERPDWEPLATELAARSLAADDPTGWFERIYAFGRSGTVSMPWDRPANPMLLSWLVKGDVAGGGRTAVVVGCGLGEDAAELAKRGFRTTAFDIAPTAVTVARERHPASTVDYRVADLFALPAPAGDHGRAGRVDLDRPGGRAALAASSGGPAALRRRRPRTRRDRRGPVRDRVRHGSRAALPVTTAEPDDVRYGVFLTPDARTSAAVTMITSFLRAQFGLVSAGAFPPHVTLAGSLPLRVEEDELLAAVGAVVRRRPSFVVRNNGISGSATR